MTECYFTPKKDTTSATICANCGQEKSLHTIGEGIKVKQTIIQTDVQNGMLAEEGNLKNDSPYCRLCDSCGHEGCCDFIQCFSQLIKNDKCEYGETYLRDARFSFRTSQLAYEVINKLENGLYDSKLAVEQYRKEWNKIYNEVYKVDD